MRRSISKGVYEEHRPYRGAPLGGLSAGTPPPLPQRPLTDGFVADDDATHGKQILNVTEAEMEASFRTEQRRQPRGKPVSIEDRLRSTSSVPPPDSRPPVSLRAYPT